MSPVTDILLHGRDNVPVDTSSFSLLLFTAVLFFVVLSLNGIAALWLLASLLKWRFGQPVRKENDDDTL